MDKSSLREIGLTDGEIEVYLSLLKEGLSSTGQIIKSSNLQSSSVYHILDSLINKGIVSFEIKNKVKFYHASSPENLLDLFEEKKKALENGKDKLINILPLLNSLSNTSKSVSQSVLIYEGWKGVYSAFKEAYSSVKPDMTLYAYTLTEDFGGANPEQVRWLINKIRELRVSINKKTKNKIYTKIIAEKESKIGLDQSKTPYTEVRFIDKKFTSPAVINIYGNITIIALWLKNPLAFYITSKEVADSFRNNFDLLWEFSRG